MDGPLSDQDRQTLLRAARDAIASAVEGRHPDALRPESEGRLASPGACFVTLYQAGRLRGCIGGVVARLPLAAHVRTMAQAAALRDPRFPPLRSAELTELHLSVSVLTPLWPLRHPDDLRLGTDGLVVTRRLPRGVLLPQVAVDHGWDRETFLAQACRKAGLTPDAWRHPETTLEAFSAEVFGEGDTL